jgi:hypothetical protein
MKLMHVVGVAIMAYFAVVGVNELVATDNATLDSLPDFGLLTGSISGSADYLAGGLDLAAAAVIYFFVLHKHIVRT